MNDTLYQIAVFAVPLVIAIVFHEVAHGYVARLLGDRTASRMGRLTLNPIRHIDPVGTLAVPMMLALLKAPIFGWAKPVPVLASNLRHPRWDMALVALAGPGSNLLLALLTAITLSLLPLDETNKFLIDVLIAFLNVNVFLAIFNLLPVPPFDGGHVVEAVLPRGLAIEFSKLHRYAFPVMLILLVVLPSLIPGADIVARVIGPIVDFVIRGLLAFVGLPV